MPDATQLEETAETIVQDLQPEAYDGPRCEKCGIQTTASACPKCGWYPSLGVFVEIDEAYETIMQTTPDEGEPADGQAAAAASPRADWQKHLEVWKTLIPGWAWLMLGSTGGVIALAIATRVATLTSPTWQMYCGVGGLLGGAAVTLAVHLIAFVLRSSEDPDLGAFDALVKPVKAWKPLLAELPKKLWLANTANVGLSTALGAAFIVGGVPYEHLLDWGFKARPKPNLIAMIAERASAIPEDDKDLEGAMGDFAGKAAGNLDGKPKAAEPKPRQPLECLILGYQVTEEGELQSLLLAADNAGKLKYVGKVRPNLKTEEAAELLDKLGKRPSARPFIRTNESGSWVRPKFTCKATYTEWPKGRRPKDLRWEELLDEI